MEVLSVSMQGINLLAEFANTMQLPTKMSRITNHVCVRFFIKASLPQLLVAKQMATKFAVWSEESPSLINGMRYPYPLPKVEEIQDNLKGLLPDYLNNPDTSHRVSNVYINFSDDVDKMMDVKSLMMAVPIGAVSATAYVDFSGYDLIGLFDGNISDLFSDVKLYYTNPTDEELEEIEIKLVHAFVNKLNHNWMYEIVQNTQLTNEWLKKNEYNVNIDKFFALKKIYLEGTDKEASFIDAGDELTGELKEIGDNFKNKTNHVYADIICSTPIYMYYLFMFTLPKGTIIDCEDYIDLIAQPREFYKVHDIVNPDENTWDGYYANQIQPVPDDEMNVLMKHSMIPGTTKISYTIRVEIGTYGLVDFISTKLKMLAKYEREGCSYALDMLIKQANLVFKKYGLNE